MKRSNKLRTNSATYTVWLLTQNIQVTIRRTYPDMTTVFHAIPHGRPTEIKHNLGRKKLHGTNQGLNIVAIW